MPRFKPKSRLLDNRFSPKNSIPDPKTPPPPPLTKSTQVSQVKFSSRLDLLEYFYGRA
jgi:hypothetical protein